jgi:Asp/Glu/hydantoin racemase
MAERILVVNPNSSASCTAGIVEALAPFASPGLPRFEVVSLPEGPPAIVTWRDWHAVVEPLCRLVERELAAAYVVACVSDPRVDALRTVTRRPVIGPLRAASCLGAGACRPLRHHRPRRRVPAPAAPRPAGHGRRGAARGAHPMNLPWMS